MKLGVLPRKQNLCANSTNSSQILDPLRGHSTVLVSKHRAKEEMREFSIRTQWEDARCRNRKSASGKTEQKDGDSTELHA